MRCEAAGYCIAVSRENVEIVNRVWEAWDRRDMEALFALYDPAIVWESHTGPIELGGPYHGHEGVRHVFQEWLEPFETFGVLRRCVQRLAVERQPPRRC
jgi:ketosteroid isomerase-like protein